MIILYLRVIGLILGGDGLQNVKIPRRFFKTVKRKTKEKGTYDDLGNWIEGNETLEDVKAFYCPYSPNELKNYPQSMIEIGDFDIRTKQKLEKGDIIIIESREMKIVNELDYSYLADLNFYVGRWSSKDG